jgi:predicted lipoprotein with Yx(FWY)xxD motif
VHRGLEARDFGTITLPNGTEQVTFDGQPLYLFSNEAVTLGSSGPVSEGNGNGITAFGGTFAAVGAGG